MHIEYLEFDWSTVHPERLPSTLFRDEKTKAEMALIADGEGPELPRLAEFDAKHSTISLKLVTPSTATEAHGPNKSCAFVHQQTGGLTKWKSSVQVLERGADKPLVGQRRRFG